MKLRDALKGKVPEDMLGKVPSSFDIIGDVAIIEIPPELDRWKKDIAKALKDLHPRLRTVCNKTGDRSGDFRLPSLELLLGTKTETEHLEYGCRFRVDVRKAYFSAREATERQRIAGMVKPGEKVLVMFSGVCPSPIAIARRQPAVGGVVGVDINPDAHRYALENIRINRATGKVEALCGDVREVCPPLGKFDRILMPLPKGAHEFLDVAFGAAGDGAFIHFYHWDREEDPFGGALRMACEEARRARRKITVLGKRMVLPYGPGTWKVCIDFRVQ